MLGKHSFGEENAVFCLRECSKFVAQTLSPFDTAEHTYGPSLYQTNVLLASLSWNDD